MKRISLTLLFAFMLVPFAGAQDSFNDHDPRWSPDGSKFVFYSDRSGNFEIYTANIDGSGLARLTDSPAYDGSPDWSPDGKYITFSSDREGGRNIYIMNSDGTGLRSLLADMAMICTIHRWSPDGQRIALECRRDRNSDIYMMNADGSGLTRLTEDPANDFAPVWSPDGSFIYFQSNRNDKYHLFRMDSGGMQVEALTSGDGHHVMGSIHPGGNKLVYISHGVTPSQLFMLNLSDGVSTQLTDDGVGKNRAEFSPDGSNILFNNTTVDDEGKVSGTIHLIGSDGSGEVDLSETMSGEK